MTDAEKRYKNMRCFQSTLPDHEKFFPNFVLTADGFDWDSDVAIRNKKRSQNHVTVSSYFLSIAGSIISL
jgi:hypothetical protein